MLFITLMIKMKNLFIVILCSFSLTVQAQFDAGKYFTDTISFSYQECEVSIVKKKEVTRCTTRKYITRIIGDQFTTTEITYWPSGTIVNKELTEYDGGKFTSIDFNKSTIEPIFLFKNSTTTPAQVFVLKLVAKDMQHWFASVSKYFPVKATEHINLYFSSIADAEEAKSYLRSEEHTSECVISIQGEL